MKKVSVLLFIFLCGSAIAQRNRNPYIYDSTLQIGHIKLVEYPNSKLFFQSYISGIDTSENHKDDYSATIKFTVIGALVNRTIILTFNRPVDDCELICANGLSHTTIIHNNDKTEYKFIINRVTAKELSFAIFSKNKIHVKIHERSKYITP